MISDAHDKALLALLRNNSRTTVADLARELGLSRSTVKDRIARLENRGVIKGYSLVLGDDYTRGKVSAHVMINLESNKASPIVPRLKQIPQITKAYAVSGIYDLIVLVEAQSPEELDEILDLIRELDGIKNTLTSVLLSKKIDR